jgi:alkylation response protein AidB-like acyl-CoA dehydrogenase
MLDELKRYLDVNFPAEHEGPTGGTPEWSSDEEFEWVRAFNGQLARDGWLVAHWPTLYGGRGLSPIDNMLIREELAFRRVPIANANGLDMVAPILLELGTTEQKDQHLRKIATMEELWCQGFSEPEAGSDLTSLRTTARRDGDFYVVNGSKIWTGHAMHAAWMILLARTDPESRGSRGLSLLMVNMAESAGLSVHPIRSLTGGVTFCQEFFTDMRVPVSNLIGPEHNGWRASRVLLQHERARAGTAALYRRDLDDLLQAVADRGGADPHTAIVLGRMIERVEAARAMGYDVASALGDGAGRYPPHMPSVIKIFSAGLGTDIADLSMDALGLDIAEYKVNDGHWDFWLEFLNAPIGRIGGGSSEIQHDIIASTYLGLDR